MPSIILALAACTVQPRTVSADQVISVGDARLELPRGAVPPGVEVRMRSLGDPAEHGIELEGELLSELWVIEPVGLALNTPATLQLAVSADAAPTTFLMVDGELEPQATTWTDGLAVTDIPQLGQVLVANNVIVPVDTASPTPPPSTPPPSTPPPSTPPTLPTPPTPSAGLPPLGSHPSPGDIWSCGTGADDVLDLTTFDDTAVPVPATVASCVPGTVAHVDGIAYADLASAIGAAGSGAIVEICPGVHQGRYSVAPGVTLRGHADDPGSTVLTAALTGPVLAPMGSLTLERLTIRRGYAGYSGGGLSTGDTITAIDTIWEQNTACYEGGALDGTGPVHILDSHFEDNKAAYGAGAATVGIRWDPSDVTIEGSTFLGNWSGYDGGALKVDGNGGFIHVLDCDFEDNHAGYSGGAISNGSWDSHLLSIEDCTFDGNHAGYEAGAVDLSTRSTTDEVVVRNTTFIGNTAPDASAINISSWGGGDFDFFETTIEGTGSCVITAGMRFATTLHDVDFVDSTVPTAQVCIANNADVAIDGVSLP